MYQLGSRLIRENFVTHKHTVTPPPSPYPSKQSSLSAGTESLLYLKLPAHSASSRAYKGMEEGMKIRHSESTLFWRVGTQHAMMTSLTKLLNTAVRAPQIYLKICLLF